MEAKMESTTTGALKIADGIQPALDGLISAMAEHVASRAVYQLNGPSAEAALAKLQQAYVSLNDACDKAQLQLEAERLQVIKEQSIAAEAKVAAAPGGELKQMQDIQSLTAFLFSELQKSAPPPMAPPPEATPPEAAPAVASIERSRTVALPSSSLPGLQEVAAELQGQQPAPEAAAAAAAAPDDDVIMVAAAPEETPPPAEAQPHADPAQPQQEATTGGLTDTMMAVTGALGGPDDAQQLKQPPEAPAALATPMDGATATPAAPEAPPAPEAAAQAAQAAPPPAAADMSSGAPTTTAQDSAMMPPPQPVTVSPFSAIQQHVPGSLALAPSADGPVTELLTATSLPATGTAAEQTPAPAAAAADGAAAPAAAAAPAQAGDAPTDDFMLGRMESLPQLPSMDMEGFLDL